MNRTFLLVDNNELIRAVMKKFLANANFCKKYLVAGSSDEALQKLEENTVEIVLLDPFILDGPRTQEFFDLCFKSGKVKSIVTSAYSKERILELLHKYGIKEINFLLEKPFYLKDLEQILDKCIKTL